MCGICGIFDRSGTPNNAGLLDQMMSILQHRGPDGQGHLIDGEIALGHRRLSIIDLGGGAQPISNETGSVHVVFNGEIYNFVELRRELEVFGHVFATHSDTEVIVHAYEQWGVDCVRRFNGMFAFAIWDKEMRRLFLARDHLGIKPLYHVNLGERILFASEVKALLQDPACPCQLDVEALAELFTFRYVPSPKTLFRNIRKLPPGHIMLISQAGVETRLFWDWVPKPRKQWDEAELIAEYQALLEDSVRLQLRSDVPLGLFLSSGIDSGTLLAIMSRHSSGPVKTFTIGFEGGEKSNEVDDARDLAKRFGADHNFQMLTDADYLSYYERYLWDLEEPVGSESAAAFYFVARLAGKHVKVALTGQGADEPWAGYDRYIGVKLSKAYSRLPSLVTRGIGSLVQRVPGRMERLKRGVASLSERDVLTRFAKVYSFFSEEMKAQLFKGILKDRFERDPYGPREAIRALQSRVEHLDPLTQMLYIDTRANLADYLLIVGDKTSMANSLEVRVPFLDYRLVEFIESLPAALRLKGLTAKYLHKKAVEKWLPHPLVYRRKKGFENPVDKWFRTSMRSFVEETLLRPDAGIAQYFDAASIRRMLEQDRNGEEEYRRHIYLLVSLELWHQAFVEGRGSRRAVPSSALACRTVEGCATS